MRSFNTRDIKEFLHSGTSTATAANIVIAVVALGAIAGVIAIAPAIFIAIDQFSGRKLTRRQVNNTYASLKRRGFIEVKVRGKNSKNLELTDKGRARLGAIVLKSITIPVPRRWDRKWRFVIFDLPKSKEKIRDEFRFKLKDLGFRQYQGSVWVYPYPCEKEIREVAEFFTIWGYVDVLEVKSFFGEQKMFKHFRKKCDL